MLFGVPPIYAMVLLMASTLFYTILGGVRSSSYIDFLQTMIVVAGLIMAIPILVGLAGGLRVAGEVLHSLDTRLTGWWYNAKQILGFSLAFGLTMAAAPYEMARYYSMRDKATVRYAIGVTFLFQGMIGSSVLIIGLMMRVLFPRLASFDQASSVMAMNLLSPIAGSLFLIAMISAIMSSSNSILLVTSAGVSHDLFGKLLYPQATDRQKLFLNRVCIVVLGAIPVWFALQRFSDVQSIVVWQAQFVASFFFVPMVMGLNSRFGTRPGAIAAMIGGFLGCLFWAFWAGNRFPSIIPAEVGIGVSAVLYFGVSALTRRPA